jgi:hypothetical protein
MSRLVDTYRGQLRIGRPARLILTHACDGYVERGHGDPRWHRFKVQFSGFGFDANFSLETWLMPFIAFRDGLIVVDRELRGEARLETIEHDFQLQGHIDKIGHIQWTGNLLQPAGEWKARLHFSLEDDQTSLRGLIAQLDTIIENARNEVD